VIFYLTIPNEIDRNAMAADIRHLIEHYGVDTTTYRPENPKRDIGIEAKNTISQKLLGRIIGLIQRRGYEITSSQQDNQ
tara:strand:+ start:606 stop:842 length:237 start_codon:yes stop_codon:yes gene_type:complete